MSVQPAEVSALLNPNLDLPDVWLADIDGNEVVFEEGGHSIVCEDRTVGLVTIVIDESAKEAWFASMRLDPGEEGHHYGTAMYKNTIQAAVEQGYRFRNDPRGARSASAYLWHKFAWLGLARIVEEFRPEDDRIKGYYVIEPATTSEQK